jgi:hypothetical protein
LARRDGATHHDANRGATVEKDEYRSPEMLRRVRYRAAAIVPPRSTPVGALFRAARRHTGLRRGWPRQRRRVARRRQIPFARGERAGRAPDSILHRRGGGPSDLAAKN